MTAVEATWNSERVELLKSRFDAGLSCGQIAREIGVTRNAVIGKLSRLGLSRPRAVRAMQPERKEGMWRPRIATRQQILRTVHAAPPPAEEPLKIGHGCSLLELSQGNCRWPINDAGAADFRFCGNEPVKGLPYCVHHARIAYQPARQRAVRP